MLHTQYMLRTLGQNEYGLYSIVASLIAHLTILDFGFGNAIVRYTAKFIAESKVKEQDEHRANNLGIAKDDWNVNEMK